MCSKCHGTGYKEEWVPVSHIVELIQDALLKDLDQRANLRAHLSEPPAPPTPESDTGVVIKEGGWPPKS